MQWYVISPEYDYTEYIDEYGGPTYPVRDVVEVEADTAREARIKGVAMFEEWTTMARGDDINPFTGVKAEPICSACMPKIEEGNDTYDCEVCGEWWRYNEATNLVEQGSRYSQQQKIARIRAYERERAS